MHLFLRVRAGDGPSGFEDFGKEARRVNGGSSFEMKVLSLRRPASPFLVH